jgi:hypothetical protein
MKTSFCLAVVVVSLLCRIAGADTCRSDNDCTGGRTCDAGSCKAPAVQATPYVAASVGTGYMTMSESKAGMTADMSAFTLGLRGAAGLALNRNLAVYLRFGYDPSITTPSVSAGGHDTTVNGASVTQTSVGPAVAYAWSATDSVYAAVLASKLDYSINGMSGSTDWGYGFCVGGSKDWRVSPWLRAGITSELMFSAMTDPSPTGESHASTFSWLIGVVARN